jgi:hypothetical protein
LFKSIFDHASGAFIVGVQIQPRRKSMINGFVAFDRFRSQEEVNEFVKKAFADNHGVFYPTHPLRKDGETVGYFSIGAQAAVICFAWLSTKDVPARESFHLINSVECLVSALPRDKGIRAICFPVPKESPFHPLMEPMGYKNGGTYDFFIKEL